jgi:hypothetical protein
MLNERHIAAYLNKPCVFEVLPATKTNLSAVNAALGASYTVRIALKDVAGTAGEVLGFGGFRPTAALTETINHAGTVPYMKSTGWLLTLSDRLVTTDNTDKLTINGVVYEADADDDVASPKVRVDMTGSGSKEADLVILAATINAVAQSGITATASGATMLITCAVPTAVSEALTNGTLVAAPLMSGGVAELTVMLPVGTYVAAETVTVTSASFTTPDGRTMAGGTSVMTLG